MLARRSGRTDRLVTHRELPEGLLPFDNHPIIYVPATQWACPRCDPLDHNGSHTTVAWIGTDSGTLGRCSRCGQKLELALMGEAVPTLEEQEHGL